MIRIHAAVVLAILPITVLTACCALAPDGASRLTLSPPDEARARALEPLTQVEIDAALALLEQSGDLAAGRRIVSLDLVEPAKDVLDALAQSSDTRATPQRNAAVVIFDRRANATVLAEVDLTAGSVLERRELTGVQPLMATEDFQLASDLVHADPRWRAALAKRGITDPDAVYLDAWAPGSEPVAGADGVRLSRVLTTWQGAQKNPYGAPVEGVVAVVDLTHERVLEVTDTTVAPLSKTSTDFFDPKVRGKERGAGHAIVPVQEGGSSARSSGNVVEWEGWTFVWSFHDREGLVMHDVRCDGRSILHRASISEMWVPYGDSDPAWAWRNAFDAGEYGLGSVSHEVVAGRDVPANARLFPTVRSDASDVGAHERGTVAMWEQDGGILWNHDGPETIGVRARELVMCFFATVGNYDYVFRWVLALDGAIRFETDLTGILLTKGSNVVQCGACRDGDVLSEGDERYGTVVADHVVAINHQHFIALRLDFDVDGRANSVRECDVGPDPDPRRGGRNGFVAQRKTLVTEKAAMRDVDGAKHRTWEVFNPSSRSALGHQRGYSILPGATAVPYARVDSPERELARFADHVMWVTRKKDGEVFAAGDWPSQARAAGGLPVFVADDESIVGEDVVVWYVMGLTHVARPEDYPVMPAVHAGVSFVPTGFFERNPAFRRE